MMQRSTFQTPSQPEKAIDTGKGAEIYACLSKSVKLLLELATEGYESDGSISHTLLRRSKRLSQTPYKEAVVSANERQVAHFYGLPALLRQLVR